MAMRAILAAALVFAVAAPAFAHERGEAGLVEISVRHDDLDLTRAEDAEQMMSRLRAAAARACAAPEIERPTPAARREMQACRDEALEAAVAALDQEQLARLHQTR
ncbi:MAG: UrcA family protein [Hyphomonadaceae bacterium]